MIHREGRPKNLPRFYKFLLAAGLFLSSVPVASPDALGFLPSKEAQSARQILTRLDAYLETWNALESRYADEVRKVRAASAGPEDATKIRSLLAAGVDGSWTGGVGPSLARVRADSLNQAKLLEIILEPRLDRLESKVLAGLFQELAIRVRRVPGAVPAYLEFAERAAEAGPSGARFALRALMTLTPESISLRLGSDDAARPAYAGPPELADEAARIRKIRQALEELKRAAPAVGLPEMPWTEAEAAAVERAVRALSLLDSETLSGIPDSATIPGFRLLPAFLAGLSPEDRAAWARRRGISPRAAEVFLRYAPAALGTAVPGASGSGVFVALPIALAELERDIAAGTGGIELLFRATDPALRLVLRSEEGPRSVRAALSEARNRLAADLESALSRNSAGLVHRVEIEDVPGVSGFSRIRAFALGPEGILTSVPPSAVHTALEGLLAEVPRMSGASVTGLELGLIVESSARVSAGDIRLREAPVPLEFFQSAEGLSPAAFAALSVYIQEMFRETARASGIAPAYLMPSALGGLLTVCEARCLGAVEDAAVEGALVRAGGKRKVGALWTEAVQHLEATRRSIEVYRGQEEPR